MKTSFLLLFLTTSMLINAQNMELINLKNEKVYVVFCSKEKTQALIHSHGGKQDDSLRLPWTARTFKLSNGNILIEFYDGQAALLEGHTAFQKLDRIRFVKNSVRNLRKNISYKIELSIEEGSAIAGSGRANRLLKYSNGSLARNDFAVYALSNGQILSLDRTEHSNSATIFKDIKTLASENNDIQEIEYGFEDETYYMKELAKGNSFDDFEVNKHLVYPTYILEIIDSHKLSLRESKVYVHQFGGNLYESEKGYWVLIDDAHQPNGAGDVLPILTLRIYEDLDQVRKAQADYVRFKKADIQKEHFYQQISDQYGSDFPNQVEHLISKLPGILNIDPEHLSMDKRGLAIVNEAIKWHHNDQQLFEVWFPSVLAYYGQFYIKHHEEGKWESKFDPEYRIWIPQISLDDGSSAFDMRDFYNDLFESAVPIEWAGDFEGKRKEVRKKFGNRP